MVRAAGDGRGASGVIAAFAVFAAGPIGCNPPVPELSAEQRAVGARVYTKICTPCHQENGLGRPGAFPPLDGSDWVTGDEAHPVAVVLQGLEGKITVRGRTFHAEMPAFGERLSDDEIAAVVSYIRAQWSNRAAPVSATTVARMRRVLAGSGPIRGGEALAELPAGP